MAKTRLTKIKQLHSEQKGQNELTHKSPKQRSVHMWLSMSVCIFSITVNKQAIYLVNTDIGTILIQSF